jgi:hypothetical protein
MWCSNCQQDVPGLGAASSGQQRCGKCGSGLPAASSQQPAATALADDSEIRQQVAADSAALARVLRGAPLGDEDWALEAELRGVQRLVTSLKSHTMHAPAANPIPAPHLASAWQDATEIKTEVLPQPRSHAAAWMILSLGLATFACGAVLLGWSLVAQREDLWPVGMPLTLIGQAGLILGLVLQLDGLWVTSRKTAAAICELDGELKNVRQATTLLSASHSGGAQSFYLHLAEGASPQLLLADLKGQMDLLAQQMARHGK